MQGIPSTCLAWENRAAVSETRSSQLRTAFLEELQNARIAPAKEAQPCSLQVTMDRTPDQLVLVARIVSGDAKRTLISRLPSADVTPGLVPGSSLRVKKELLWQQSERILDALLVADASAKESSLLTLQRETVVLYRKDSSGWVLHRTWPLPNATADQRAPRGELTSTPDRPATVKIVLPGRICLLNLNEATPPVCEAAPQSWRQQVLLPSPCSSSALELRADSGDWSVPDRIAILDSSHPQAQPALTEVNLPGPVLSISAAGASPEAAAVVFNLSTGNYEAYAITLDCAN
jgi:hypothetical protein